MEPFDLKPGPRVLVALTHTAMKPIDALCELVDNAIDSLLLNPDFQPAGGREINIDLPTTGELDRGAGAIRVTDNGPGMIPGDAQKALTAGYSGKNSFDSLGMFGMGLNIATGKFSRTTRLITATKDSDKAVVVEVDLNKLIQQGDFKVQPKEEPKSKHFGAQESGTIIELSNWWGGGNVNEGFPRKLIVHGPGRIRDTLGRRYATLLRDDSPIPTIRVLVKGERCTPFEHCVWGENRSIVRGSSIFPARQTFNAVLHEQARCIDCNQQVDGNVCPVDASHEVRQIEERVRGWIGVQRFDSMSDFGIDLVRRGRTICSQEQEAFFKFVDETGKAIKDYPVDGPYGRIVGEVHLDHVPVDFAKQNFIRATSEWDRAMEFLRGNSSLQPKQEGAEDNHSPVKKIFDGYRRVRGAGLGVMYMGERPTGQGEVGRVSRGLEREYYQKFLNKEEGYYTDEKWWEKVEEASMSPEDDMQECPHCGVFQNPTIAERCGGCDALLLSKTCLNAECAQEIPQSAVACEHCGQAQVPEGPWKCNICGYKNSPDTEECQKCGKQKGAVNSFAKEILLANSVEDSNLSVQDIEIPLPDGNMNQKFHLRTRTAKLRSDGIALPAVVFTDLSQRELLVFLDKEHAVFSSLQLHPEHAVAAEAAAVIHAETGGLMSGVHKHQQNLLALQNKILDKYWREQLLDSPEEIQRAIRALLDDVCMKMAETMQDIAEDIFNGMPPSQMQVMVRNMQGESVDMSKMGELKSSGKFLLYIPPETVISVFREHPSRFFDRKVWIPPWTIPGIPEDNVREEQKRLKGEYLNFLEDIVVFLQARNPAPVASRRANLSLQALLRGMDG